MGNKRTVFLFVGQTEAMRFLSVFLLLGFLSINSLITQASPVRKIVPKGTISYMAKSQKFAIWLPEKPTEEDNYLHLKKGEEGNSFGFEVLNTEVKYSIVSASKASDPKRLPNYLDPLQATTIRDWDSKLQKRQDLNLSGYSGRELTLKTYFNAPIRVRMFDTPRFLYMITARGEKALTPKQNAEINRVFDSFRILK